MKKFLGKAFRFLALLLYPVIVILLIATAVVLFLRMRDIDNALNTYENLYETYALEGTPKKNITNAMKDIDSIIAGLYDQIENSSKQIADLEDKVEKEQKDGFGEIKGSILAFVSEGQASFNRYQRVCAATVENENKQYCVTVSTLQKSYSLVVPTGEYYVFAQLLDTTQNDNKAYFTEFVSCVAEGDANCSESLSEKKALVTVEENKVIENIDPIDWQIEGIDISTPTEE